MDNLSTLEVELSTPLAVLLETDFPVTRGYMGFTIQAILLQVWRSPEGFRTLRLAEFLDNRVA